MHETTVGSTNKDSQQWMERDAMINVISSNDLHDLPP